MAEFTYTPSIDVDLGRQPRIIEARFGDGYGQRSQDGINNNRRSYQLIFRNRSITEADAIDAFLSARAGVEAFDWTPPRGGSAGRFICLEWNYRTGGPHKNEITATFREVFE